MADELAELYPDRVKNKRCRCRLADLRRDRGLTLARVSRVVGISLGFLSQVELGASYPSLPVALRLIKFYGVSLEDAWPGLTRAAETPAPDVVIRFDDAPLSSVPKTA